MADDDDDEQNKQSLPSLFMLYANYQLNPTVVDSTVYRSILLSQIDFWLDQAQLLKVKFSQTDTGMEYMKFKKWRLDYDEFVLFLEDLCMQKNCDFDTIKDQLIAAGVPEAKTERKLKA